MPEDKDTLVFETEEARNDGLFAIQDKPGGPTSEDFDEIERIQAVEVNKPSPEEGTEEEETVKPTETLEEKIPEDDARNWQIDEEFITQHDEEYTDENGRRRKFITQTNREDFVKSYIGAQKNNHYLKTQRIPQAKQEGYDTATAEYNEKLAAKDKELETLRAKPAPAPAPEPKAPVKTDTQEQYTAIVEELNGITDEDSIEHTAKMKKAFVLQQKLLEEERTQNADNINNMKTEMKTDFDSKFTAFEAKQAEERKKESDRVQAITNQSQQNETVNKLYTEIDDFVSGKDAPPEAKTDESFTVMNAKALKFHNDLAEAYTGRAASSYSQQEWSSTLGNVESMWLNGTPELLTKAKEIGITEPKNYKAWSFLDNIDAIRGGMMRDPATNQWVNKFDPNSGEKVNLGDIKTAYNWYLDNSGKRQELETEKGKKKVEEVVHAINKRDKGVVQLDESQMTSEGEGQALTKEDAEKILEGANMDLIRAKEMEGDLTQLERVNAALERLDMPPIAPVFAKKT